MQHETSDIFERITNQIVALIETGAGSYRMQGLRIMTPPEYRRR